MRWVDLNLKDCKLFLQPKMGLFGISKELQFGVCNHGKPCPSPCKARERECFYTGEKEVGEGYSKQSPWLFIGWVLVRKEDSFFFLLGSGRTPPSDLPTFFFFFLFMVALVGYGSFWGLGVQSELQLRLTPKPQQHYIWHLSCVCDLSCSLQQHHIFNPLSEARDWTHILTDTILGS